MIEVNQLGKRFPDKKLFENVTLRFNKGNTYGVIGANGAGKSTFLKILSGKMEATEGKVIIEAEKRISVLEQNHALYDEFDVTTTVIMGNKELYNIQKEKDAIYMDPDATPEDYEKAAHLEEEFGAKGG